jgi:ABC-type polysaccharide/polyol phosphate transport system ATPase subunit
VAFIKLDHVSVDFPVFDSRSRSLRSSLMRATAGAVRRVGVDSVGHVTVHALTDISLALLDGDRVGLIGRNGSGKSTLLRLLSGVYEPTRGVARINGTCCSLLDLTLGMDVEASGWDNITLRGVALGMSLKEIDKVRDDIAAFTELGDHLDLPVRTYSSGMMLRLAFAVSTAVRRDIVVLDEVIGVGDASFMHKAKQRLDDMMTNSSLLVVASHSPDVLKGLCNKGLYMREGRIAFFGPIDEALAQYAAEQ